MWKAGDIIAWKGVYRNRIWHALAALVIEYKAPQLAFAILDLDLIIDPDLSFKWKDGDDYQAAIDHGLISIDWINGIENAKAEVFEKLDKRAYPFNGAWFDCKPGPQHSNPLPANRDEL